MKVANALINLCLCLVAIPYFVIGFTVGAICVVVRNGFEKGMEVFE